MFTVVSAVDSELQTWEKETKEEAVRLVKELTEESEGVKDVLVFPCRKSILKVATTVELG